MFIYIYIYIIYIYANALFTTNESGFEMAPFTLKGLSFTTSFLLATTFCFQF